MIEIQPTQKASPLPYLASAASAVIFGFSFFITKNALGNLDMLQLLGLRFLAAATFMLLLKTLKLIKIAITLEKAQGLLLVALFQPVLYFIFETAGVNLTTASVSGIVVSLVPIAVAILAGIILKERLRAVQWLSILASVGGVVLITLPQANGGGGTHAIGIVALLGAVLSSGLYSIFSKKASSSSTPAEVTYVMMWVGALVFNSAGLIKFSVQSRLPSYFRVLAGREALFAVFYLGILSSVAAFFFMNYSLSKLSPSQAAVFINVIPIISIFAGVVLGGETFGVLQALGSAFVLAGVWGVNK